MSLFPNIKTTKRIQPVQMANGTDLTQGICLIAAGVLVASIATCKIPQVFQILSLIGGILFLFPGIHRLIRFIKQNKAFHDFIPEWDSKRSIYDAFAKELNAWYETDTLPESCDGDTAYFLKLQKKRLYNKGLSMTNVLRPSKGESYGTACFSHTSSWYTTDMLYEDISRQLTFSDQHTVLYERKLDQTMYETVVHSPNEAELTHMTMTCPNCGAVSPVSKLTEGCPYCHTCFKITDLFPRVTNQFFLRMSSIAKNTDLTRILIWGTIALVFIILLIACMIGNTRNPEDALILPLTLLTCYLGAAFCGGFGGLILADLVLLYANLNMDGAKHIPMFKVLHSKKKLTRILSASDPYFSFQKFEGQMISLIKMAVFSENPSELAAYMEDSREPEFSDIVEMTYIDAIALQKQHREGNLLQLSLRTWWINYSEHNGKIKKTGDCIDVTLTHDITHIDPPGFSITSVSCPNCGSSFDAVRQSICPNCQTRYHMEEQTWVIQDMKLIR